MYKVGASSSPAATYPVNESTGSIVPSGTTIGILDSGYGTGAVVDLSGTSPVSTSFNTPIAYLSAYGAVSPSQWVVGNQHGALLDGASLGGTPRHFGYGRAWSIAGGGQTLAIATAIGQVLYFDASTLAQEGSIEFPATELALSSDGGVLSAAGDLQDSQYAPTEALNVYSMPAGTLVYAWPYTVGGTPALGDFTLSGSGTVIGQVIYSGSSTCLRQVTAATGGPVLWSDTNSAACDPARDPAEMAIRLSPDGTWIAVSEAPVPGTQASTYPTTNLYQNGSLVATVQGWVVGWLDASHILVNNYAYSSTQVAWSYVNSTVYDTSGTKVTDLQFPLGIGSLQAVSPGSIYSPDTNAIYSTTTGMAIWTGGQSSGPGAVAGTYAVAVYGSQVIATQF